MPSKRRSSTSAPAKVIASLRTSTAISRRVQPQSSAEIKSSSSNLSASSLRKLCSTRTFGASPLPASVCWSVCISDSQSSISSRTTKSRVWKVSSSLPRSMTTLRRQGFLKASIRNFCRLSGALLQTTMCRWVCSKTPWNHPWKSSLWKLMTNSPKKT